MVVTPWEPGRNVYREELPNGVRRHIGALATKVKAMHATLARHRLANLVRVVLCDGRRVHEVEGRLFRLAHLSPPFWSLSVNAGNGRLFRYQYHRSAGGSMILRSSMHGRQSACGLAGDSPHTTQACPLMRATPIPPIGGAQRARWWRLGRMRMGAGSSCPATCGRELPRTAHQLQHAG